MECENMTRFDIVIFGATGFTGKKVVEEVVRIAKKYGNLTWAVAGRSQSKLENVLVDISRKTGQDLTLTKLILADVGNEESLKSMCSQAKVLVNCCGPYILYGEPVVKAAIESKAHHVDITWERQFIETIQLEYDKAASDAGVYIVNACGLDSIPNDMGVVYLQQQFDGVLNSIESYMLFDISPRVYVKAVLSGVIHYPTWESIVYSLSHYSEIQSLSKKLYPDPLPTFQPSLKPRSVHMRDCKCSVPYFGPDESVVYRTQRHLYENDQKRPVQYKVYLKIPNLFFSIFALMIGGILYLMFKKNYIKPLLKYPRLFTVGLISRQGPSEEVMENTTFAVDLYGKGWRKDAEVDSTQPNKKITAKVSMTDGYAATATMLVLSAITILKEKEKIPGNGGVLTPGVAFYNTNLIKYLNENNVKFEIIKNKH